MIMKLPVPHKGPFLQTRLGHPVVGELSEQAPSRTVAEEGASASLRPCSSLGHRGFSQELLRVRDVTCAEALKSPAGSI